ncbi:MAG: SpoIID/LytB domain-containing protein [Thermosynechococcaceae cyanobacterium]
MTKTTLPQWFKQRPWLLPILLLPVPIWGIAQSGSHSDPNDTVMPQPLPSPTFSAFPFLNAPPPTPATPHSAVQRQLPSPSAIATRQPSLPPTQPISTPQPKPTPPPKPVLSKTELARRSQLARAALLPNVDSSVEIHVAIASGVPVLNVAVSGSGKFFDGSGRALATLGPGQSYPIQADGSEVRLGSQAVPNLVWVAPDPNSIVYLGDRGYRGNLLLTANGSKLWAINYVNLRQYLYSVVGAEVSPSWPPHALKAQAIAARSYALTYYFKPAHKLYHLGSDEYYQVYKGIESEAETTRKAVDETAGSFVSYRGGIVESLYAASDDIVAEAFQGHGMSQLGALSLAEKGYTYEQILSNYYPGTGIGRIEVDLE